MKIEFNKVLFQEKKINFQVNTVELNGLFSRIKPDMVKFDANLEGKIKTICHRCGKHIDVKISEGIIYMISDGIYIGNSSKESVIEVTNGIIDFKEIIESEIVSINNDYHVCGSCDASEMFEKEY